MLTVTLPTLVSVAMKNALLTLVSPVVLVALIAVVGTYFTARAALADVTLKRRLETAKRFAELAEVANNVNGSRGIYEQIAALELLTTFGREEPHLRGAARAVLDQVKVLGQTQEPTAEPRVAGAARSARTRLPDHDNPLHWYNKHVSG